MRAGFALMGAASLIVGIGAACSTFSSSDDAPLVEAGTEATTGDAAPPADAASDAPVGIDAALPPTPGSIDCFGATCDTTKGATCCVDTDAGTNTCASSCGFLALTFRCDDAADCAPGEHCCVGFLGDTSCSKTCTTSERLCHADSECETGSSCVKVPCHGTTIGTCGPVGGYVKAFCTKSDAGPTDGTDGG